MTLSRVDSGRNIREAFRFHKENCVRNAPVNAYREGIFVLRSQQRENHGHPAGGQLGFSWSVRLLLIWAYRAML